ncbi:MAG: ATP-dependent DNA helicase RecG [Treponema sp.]|nr:ATP-dependent DNA helicase RecG [Treponema sp.]
MKLSDIHTPIDVLPGIGKAVSKIFANLNVFSISDILQFYPRDYDDRTHITTLSQFRSTSKIHTVAKVTGHDWFGYGKMRTLKIYINDGTMEAQLIAFNRPFLEKSLPVNAIILVAGTFFVKYNALQSTAFEATVLASEGNIANFTQSPLPDSGMLPIYPLTEGLSQKIVRKAVKAAIDTYIVGLDDELPPDVIAKRGLLSKKEALKKIHCPANPQDITEARHTLIFEELFHFQYTMAQRAIKHKGRLPALSLTDLADTDLQTPPQFSSEAFIQTLSPHQKELLTRLSFTLTNDQMKVIQQMNDDIDRGYRERSVLFKESATNTHPKPVFTMARLLQGDVGSGKTLVAFFACLRTIDWSGQCALMAPTELLARQHAENAASLLAPLGIRIAFLTGNLQSKGRNQLLKALKNGDIDIVIGTHALFSSQVRYKDLQLVIIDEQHRFGVMQRNAIISKGIQTSMESLGSQYISPHLLMMSATPIPQTLALTAFGDLDISSIRTMPQGRKPITTYLVREGHEQNAYTAVRKELEAGHQAYFVYPAIEQNEWTSSNTTIKSAEEMFTYLSQKVFPDFTCAIVHSKIDTEQQNKILSDFKSGKINILIATTVVEVGVDVPNATCMVIEQADHFGLAQLHQLRGRVGRGTQQSYCFLIYSSRITETGIARMKALRQNTDGFVIAEEDLKLRGPGELTGTIQAGNLTLGIADITRDYDILQQARQDAFELMQRKLQACAYVKDVAYEQ